MLNVAGLSEKDLVGVIALEEVADDHEAVFNNDASITPAFFLDDP